MINQRIFTLLTPAAVTQAGAANANRLPKNHIARAIADRIEDAIRWGKIFHAYIVLPVHPEGSLADLAIVGQIHWTMQSLVFASDSLVNRVRLALYAKKQCKEARNQGEWEAAKKAGKETTIDSDGFKSTKYEREIAHDSVFRYLTLLNLRSCQTVAGKVCTEQAYVHSKLLIVDDQIVIVGSANINDRSLNGGRDSELAVCLTDLTQDTAPIDGKNPIPVRKLAHEMRVNLWKKHFALSGGTDRSDRMNYRFNKWLADWRIGGSDAYFSTGALSIPPMPALIDTETYGDLQKQREQTAALWNTHGKKETALA